jgi:hypothetical protein
MKARSNQPGMSKNPVSPRVHGLRFTLNSSSFGAGNHSGNSEANKPSPPTKELADAQTNSEPTFFSISDLAKRWRCSRASVYNRLRGELVLDFARPGRRGHKVIPRETVTVIERKRLRVLR